MLDNADNMPGKWQLLIFLGQQQIKQLQQKNCSLVYRRRYNNQSIAFVHPQGWRHYPKSKISVSFEVHLSLFLWLCFFYNLFDTTLSIRDGGSLLLPAKGYSGTMVRRNLHLMCATSLSSCRERYILLCGHFSTGKLSAQTAEVM